MVKGRKDVKIQRLKQNITQLHKIVATHKATKFNPRKLAKSKKLAQKKGIQLGLQLQKSAVREELREEVREEQASEIRGLASARDAAEDAAEAAHLRADAEQQARKQATRVATEASQKKRDAERKAAEHERDARKAREEQEGDASKIRMKKKDQETREIILNHKTKQLNKKSHELEENNTFLFKQIKSLKCEVADLRGQVTRVNHLQRKLPRAYRVLNTPLKVCAVLLCR